VKLSPDEDRPVTVTFTPEFGRNLRALAGHYRHIRSDMEPIIDVLQADRNV
jgi:hypothetical protein